VKSSLLFVASVFSGVIYSFGFPQHWGNGFFIFAILGLISVFSLMSSVPSFWKRLFFIWLFNLGFHFTSFYWVGGTLEEFGGLPSPLSDVLGSFLFLVHNPFLYSFLLWLHFLAPLDVFKRFPFYLRACWLAMFLTFFEIILPQQFPVYLGHSLSVFSSSLVLAPIGSVSLYSFFLFFMVTHCLSFLNSFNIKYLFSLTPLILFFLAHFFFSFSLPQDSDSTKKLKVRIVQANIGHYFKVASEKGDDIATELVFNRYQNLSLKNASENFFDLIIWPETAYPFTLPSARLKTGERNLPSLLKEVISLSGSELLVGGYDQLNDGGFDNFENTYNATYHFSRHGTLKTVYHKHRLIPFGETLPFGPLNFWLSKKLENVSFFARGNEFPLFKTSAGITFVTPICYEILDSFFIKSMLNTAGSVDFIVNITNDSWYGETAEPLQHLTLAKWRALEFGLPIIRSTNTGITSVIYPNGEESRRLKTGDEDVLDIQLVLPMNTPQTIFRRFGLFPLVGLWILLLSSILIFDWVKNRR
jgi:apolipoprotein N-acyltransferase